MRLADVNVLVYSFRTDAPAHGAHRGWLEALVASDEAYAVSDHVLAGFLRIVTHPRVFLPPTPLESALAFTTAFRERANAVPVQPGARHWGMRLATATAPVRSAPKSPTGYPSPMLHVLTSAVR